MKMLELSSVLRYIKRVECFYNIPSKPPFNNTPRVLTSFSLGVFFAQIYVFLGKKMSFDAPHQNSAIPARTGSQLLQVRSFM
jgi:hypothetical protein